MSNALDELVVKILHGSTSDADPEAVLSAMRSHELDSSGRCACGSTPPDPLEHITAAILAVIEPLPRAEAALQAKREWLDGAINQIDRLLDYGRNNETIATALSVPVNMVRRRRRERKAMEKTLDVIAPDRQMEIAMAALYTEDQPSKEQAA